MTREQVTKRINRIVDRDPRFRDATLKIKYSEKKPKQKRIHRGEYLSNNDEE